MTGFREASQAAKDSHQPLAIILDREFARGTPGSLRRLLRWLLATKPADRPKDGNAVVKRLTSKGWPSWGWLVAAAILLVMSALLGFRPREPLADHKELSQLNQKLAVRDAELSRLKTSLEQKQEDAKASAKLTHDLESLRSASQIKDEKLRQVADLVARPTPDLPNRLNAVLSPNAPPDPTEQAKEHWSHLKSDQPTSRPADQPDFCEPRTATQRPKDSGRSIQGIEGMGWSTQRTLGEMVSVGLAESPRGKRLH